MARPILTSGARPARIVHRRQQMRDARIGRIAKAVARTQRDPPAFRLPALRPVVLPLGPAALRLAAEFDGSLPDTALRQRRGGARLHPEI